jgi:hypothetical protein
MNICMGHYLCTLNLILANYARVWKGYVTALAMGRYILTCEAIKLFILMVIVLQVVANEIFCVTAVSNLPCDYDVPDDACHDPSMH